MNPQDLEIKKLGYAVMHWLSFKIVIGREYVLSESALKMPISEYLTQKGFDDIELEFSHPSLSKKRFDLCFSSKSNAENVFEFKYIRKSSTRRKDEKQRIFDDLMRLHLFISNSNTKSYFLICGLKDEFNTDFQKLSNNTQYPTGRIKGQVSEKSPSFYDEWFSFDERNPKKLIDLNSISTEYAGIYKDFFEDYKPSFFKKKKTILTMPNNITTRLVFLESDLDNSWQPAAIGIWEILKST